MTREELLKIIEGKGFGCHLDPKKGTVIVLEVDKGSNRKQALEDLRSMLGFGEIKSSSYSKQGGLYVDKVQVVAKEIISGGNLSSLDARTFMVGAKEKKFNYKGEDIACFFFTDHKDIEKCILKGCEAEPMLGGPVKVAFEAFFKTHEFDWSQITDTRVINKLAVYAGEVLTGWVMLQNDYKKYLSGTLPFKSKANEFYLPNDPKFSGVDCFVVCNDGTYAISNKSDVGAAASFFSNVMPGALKKEKDIKGSTLRELIKVCKKLNTTSKNKEILFEWGINHLLGMNIPSPHNIVQSITKNTISVKDAAVIDAVKKYMAKSTEHTRKGKDGSRLELMPNSITSFFNYELGSRLEKDSLADIIEIVAAKGYYQLNLNLNEMSKNGKLHYSCVKAGDTDLKLVSNKSAWKDITAKQGYLNYIVSKK